jgi:hypothetical protein
MAIKTFTTGEVLTAADTNTYLANSGLTYIAETQFSGTAVPFINGCFTSTYQNYQVKILMQPSASTNLFFRFRSGTSTTESGAVYDRAGFSFTTVANSLLAANQTEGYVGDGTAAANSRFTGTLEIFRPNEAQNTSVNCHNMDNLGNAVYLMSYRMDNATQYTGLELTALGAGTLTGSMYVYGYRKA